MIIKNKKKNLIHHQMIQKKKNQEKKEENQLKKILKIAKQMLKYMQNGMKIIKRLVYYNVIKLLFYVIMYK